MPPAPNQYSKTRRDHASETAEDYVEAIEKLIQSQGRCRVTDLAREMGVSHVTVSRILSRLVREALVQKKPYGPVSLTSKGKRMARRARERHELVQRFLVAIGVPNEDASRDAEGLEHHLSRRTLNCMEVFLTKNRPDR